MWWDDASQVPVTVRVIHDVGCAIIPLDVVPSGIRHRIASNTVRLVTGGVVKPDDRAPLVGVVGIAAVALLELRLCVSHVVSLTDCGEYGGGDKPTKPCRASSQQQPAHPKD